MEAPMPRLILITPGIASGIREMVAEFGGTFSEPGIGRGLVELDFKRAATGRCKVNCAPRVVFTESWRGTYREDVFDRQPGFQLSANDLGLPVHAAKGGNDAHGDAILARRRPEHAPCVGSSGDQQMVSAIGANFRTLEVACLLALP